MSTDNNITKTLKISQYGAVIDKIRVVDTDSCVNCGTCMAGGLYEVCPVDILQMSGDDYYPTITDPSACIKCEACFPMLNDACPMGVYFEFI